MYCNAEVLSIILLWTDKNKNKLRCWKFNLKTMINIIFNNNKIWVFFTDLLSSYFVLSENIYFFNIYKDNNIKTRGGGHFFKFPKSLDMLVEDKGSLA